MTSIQTFSPTTTAPIGYLPSPWCQGQKCGDIELGTYLADDAAAGPVNLIMGLRLMHERGARRMTELKLAKLPMEPTEH